MSETPAKFTLLITEKVVELAATLCAGARDLCLEKPEETVVNALLSGIVTFLLRSGATDEQVSTWLEANALEMRDGTRTRTDPEGSPSITTRPAPSLSRDRGLRR